MAGPFHVIALIKRLARKGGMVDVVGIMIPESTESIRKVARNQIIVEKKTFLISWKIMQFSFAATSLYVEN
jgi:hypothetical protein